MPLASLLQLPHVLNHSRAAADLFEYPRLFSCLLHHGIQQPIYADPPTPVGGQTLPAAAECSGHRGPLDPAAGMALLRCIGVCMGRVRAAKITQLLWHAFHAGAGHLWQHSTIGARPIDQSQVARCLLLLADPRASHLLSSEEQPPCASFCGCRCCTRLDVSFCELEDPHLVPLLASLPQVGRPSCPFEPRIL